MFLNFPYPFGPLLVNVSPAKDIQNCTNDEGVVRYGPKPTVVNYSYSSESEYRTYKVNENGELALQYKDCSSDSKNGTLSIDAKGNFSVVEQPVPAPEQNSEPEAEPKSTDGSSELNVVGEGFDNPSNNPLAQDL